MPVISAFRETPTGLSSSFINRRSAIGPRGPRNTQEHLPSSPCGDLRPSILFVYPTFENPYCKQLPYARTQSIRESRCRRLWAIVVSRGSREHGPPHLKGRCMHARI